MYRSPVSAPRFAPGSNRIVGPSDFRRPFSGLADPVDPAVAAPTDTVSARLDTGPVGLAMGGMQLAGVGGSALYGGFIGGVAAHSWKGATSGAIAGATIAALSYGGMNLLMTRWLWGAVMLTGGAVGGYVTYRRWQRR